MILDLTLRCPVCGARADMCFAHGDAWKKRDWHDETAADRESERQERERWENGG